MEQKDFIIVIGRQYGSGGRRVARILAEKLGIPYYDKELLASAAKEMGFRQSLFDKADEKRPSVLKSLLHFNYVSSDTYGQGALSGEKLYLAQCEVIREICSSGSCIIVGRTADYVMRDHPGLVSVFLHSPVEHRVASILERGETDNPRTALEMTTKADRKRQDYYNFYTGGGWGEAANYHLSLNASKMDPESIADFIISYIKLREGNNGKPNK